MESCDVKRLGFRGGGGGAGRFAIIGDFAEMGETVTFNWTLSESLIFDAVESSVTL